MLEECQLACVIQFFEPRQDLGCQRHSCCFGRRGDKGICHRLDRASVPCSENGGKLAPFENRGQKIRQKRHTDAPMTASGNQVAIPGKRHRMMMAMIMQATKGKDPVRMVLSEISGAIPLIT